MNTKKFISVMIIFLLAAAGIDAQDTTAEPEPVPVERTGPSFQNFYFGAHINEFERYLVRGRPAVGSHVKGEERGCEFFISRTPLDIGGYTIPITDAYFIFYNKKLVRVRIINTFGSYRNEAMNYFKDVLAGLKEKYGDTETVEQIWTRYDGRYIWEKDDLVIDFNFDSLEYTYKPLYEQLIKDVERERTIRSADL